MAGEWIGLREANAALKRLPEHVRGNVQQVMDATAFQLARKAERAAPKGATGTLSRSVVWKSRPRSLSAIVGITRDAFYWKFQEFGTVKMQARPFWRPAAQSLESDHESRMMQALEMALTRVEREAAV